MPVVGMQAYFGANSNTRERTVKDFLLKEVRVWGNQRSEKDIKINRFN
jgi:hypothetical protein